ncbi:hypothetical protein, partial [Rhizorhabdus wittichii]|uniref:hypothetical protein n=1 Tax=Rhizorhabdus wittichii TaxID=160791 RepID=UPI003AAEFB42
MAFELTAGQLGDLRAITSLNGPLPPALLCAADTAYDSNGLHHFLVERGTLACCRFDGHRDRLIQ